MATLNVCFVFKIVFERFLVMRVDVLCEYDIWSFENLASKDCECQSRETLYVCLLHPDWSTFNIVSRSEISSSVNISNWN